MQSSEDEEKMHLSEGVQTLSLTWTDASKTHACSCTNF